ncbi:hypothetical protein [Streptomyces sp. NPDC092307]|uniref:hypothetical protein n=1 Tax=Streptomyces sp. NPDC092307 TaxID=3366013 RepID=UPI0037F8AA21
MAEEQEKLREGQVRVGRCLAADPGLLVAGDAFDELGGQFGVPEGERARPLTFLLVWTPSLL